MKISLYWENQSNTWWRSVNTKNNREQIKSRCLQLVMNDAINKFIKMENSGFYDDSECMCFRYFEPTSYIQPYSYLIFFEISEKIATGCKLILRCLLHPVENVLHSTVYQTKIKIKEMQTKRNWKCISQSHITGATIQRA